MRAPSTIAAVQADHFRIELPVPLSDATHGEMTHFDFVTARVRDADGAEGMGYTYAVGGAGAAIHAHIVHDLAQVLEGYDADRIEALWQRMWWQVHFAGRGGAVAFAIAAIDVALWDLKAKRAGLPLWRLLGGNDPAVPAYVGGIDLDVPIEQLLDSTQGHLDRGFWAIKMKIGRPVLADDVARVAAMRELLGPERTLMADANMRWRVDEAVRAARALQEHELYWLEEPTLPEDVAGHARIQREGGLPIATGENFHSLAEFQAMIAGGGVSFPEPDLATCGGVTVWMKVAHLAEAHNLPVTSHGVHDLHVHLLAAVPNRSYLEVHGFGLERFMAEPLVIADGIAQAPERPGHGVDLDAAALEAHRV